MLKNLRQHALVGLSFFALTLLQQYGFFLYKGLPIIWFTPEKYLFTLVFFLVFTFAPSSRSRFILSISIIGLNFFQMAHLSYFGTQILPSEIALLFTQAGEINAVLGTEWHHLLVPLLFTLVPCALGFWLLRKTTLTYGSRAVIFLCLSYVVFNPARTYFTGNKWGRQPSTRELTGVNVYLSFSYYLGRILPAKLSGQSAGATNTSAKLQITGSQKPKWDNIILVLGESLSPNHMSLFGYEKNTTPYLKGLRENFHFIRGLSSGVSTDISVAFFFNLAYGEAGPLKLSKGQHCLIRLAKEQGLKTSFLSAQSGQQLRYISPYLCTNSLDHYESLDQISPEITDPNAVLDEVLLPGLKKIIQTKRNFIVLHQRGSHAPWSLRFSPDAKLFDLDYDNSVVQFDLFWKEFNAVLEESPHKTLVMYLSDHGESLGEGGRWGHGFLARETFEVPFLFQSFNAPLPEDLKKLPTFSTQYNFALSLVSQLGKELNQSPLKRPEDFIIYGNDIDGFAGRASVKFSTSGYEFSLVE